MSDIVRTSELSNEAHYALAYATALVGGEHSRAWRGFQLLNAKAKVTMTESDLRIALQKGLNELMARGVIECEKDGHQDWVPRTLHLERLLDDHGRLIQH